MPAALKNVRAVFFDAGQTLLGADPPVEHVYRETFAAHGVEATLEDVHRAVHATWREVDARREFGAEYDTYAAVTPGWFPRLGGPTSTGRSTTDVP